MHQFNPLSREALCNEADATCTPAAVRCLEIDETIAPLFCTGLHDRCGGYALSVGAQGDEFLPASNFECDPSRRPRPPVDWTCAAPQSMRAQCASGPTGHRTVRECVQERLTTWRYYRRAMQRLIRDSNGLEVR
jgi:hypothetical protein